MKFVFSFSVLLLSSVVFAKEAMSIKTAAIYMDDIPLNDDGTISPKNDWGWISDKASGSSTSKLYEKKSPNNLYRYAAEVRVSKDTGLQSITTYTGAKGTDVGQRVNYVAFDEATGKVTSNTMCWGNNNCITMTDEFCGRLLGRTGSKSTAALKKKQDACISLANEFKSAYHSNVDISGRVQAAQAQNFTAISNGQITQKYLSSGMSGIISKFKKSEAPLPADTVETEQQIGEAIAACDHYATTGQFLQNKKGESAIEIIKKGAQ